MSSKYRKVDYDAFALAVREAKLNAAREALAACAGNAPTSAHLFAVEASAKLGVAVVQNELMKLFAADNPKFNKLLFIEACGTGAE